MIFPNPIRFLVSVWRAFLGSLRGEDPLAPHTIVAARQRECNRCPYLLESGQCFQCTCFVSIKQQFRAEECPLGRWRL